MPGGGSTLREKFGYTPWRLTPFPVVGERDMPGFSWARFLKNSRGICKAGWSIVAQPKGFYLTLIKSVVGRC